MSARSRKKKKTWSSRKLLLLYQIYRTKGTSVFNLVDLVSPHAYPQSLHTDSYELIRILLCASNLESYGVQLHRTIIKDFTLSIVDKYNEVIINRSVLFNDLCPDILQFFFDELSSKETAKNKQYLERIIRPFEPRPGISLRVLTRALASVLKILLNEFKGLDQDGNGVFNPAESHTHIDSHLFTKLSPLFSLEFLVHRKRLNSRFRQYLEFYKSDQLLPPKGCQTFPIILAHKVVEALIQKLFLEQKTEILTFELGEPGTSFSSTEDSFASVFKDLFPIEYKLWLSGLFRFPFFEELIWMEHQGHLKIKDWVIDTHNPSFFNKLLKGEQLSRRRNYNGVKLKAYLSIDISSGHFISQDHKKGGEKGAEIFLIEVVSSDRPRYKVYLNQDRQNPIYLTQNNKAGEIIYSVAEGMELSFRRYRKNVDYINRDPNFKLYSQSDYTPTLLLERHLDEDGHSFIGPAEGVKFRLIEE